MRLRARLGINGVRLPFLLSKHGDPIFLFYFWSIITILNKWTKFEILCLGLFQGNDLKWYTCHIIFQYFISINQWKHWNSGNCSGLIVTVLYSRLTDCLKSMCCVLGWDKFSRSLQPGVLVYRCQHINLQWFNIPSRGGKEIILIMKNRIE